MLSTTGDSQHRRRRDAMGPALGRIPWWVVIMLIGGVCVLSAMLSSERYVGALGYVVRGIGLTLVVSAASFAGALAVGLVASLGRVSSNRALNTAATLYVEVVRGVPLLVIIIYMHYVVAPAIGTNRNALFSGIMALVVGYGAYLAEVYRGGIESIDRGQIEAARSLGMTHWQSMRLVVLPQAIRRVLPALANDFIALLKDSSLVSAIAISELTKLGQIYAARTYDTFSAYNSVALLYLLLTLLLSRGIARIERRTSYDR